MKDITKKNIKNFDDNNIKYKYSEQIDDQNTDVISSNWAGEQNQRFTIYIFIHENNVALRAFSIANVKENKLDKLNKLCNKINGEYRWIKMFIRENGDIEFNIDAYFENDANFICDLLLPTMLQILDEVYPKIMRIIWSEE